MPPPFGGSYGGCPAVWSISHHRGHCSRGSTVRPPHPCGSSCGAPLLGRRPPPGLCTGSPVSGCFHGSRWRLPWAPMQSSRARNSGLGVPPLLLARWVGWVAPLRPTHGVWFVVTRFSVALDTHVCAVSWSTWLLFNGVLVRCVALRVRCPGQLGSCAPVCPLGALSRVCGVLRHLVPVHQCAPSVPCVVCAVYWATWLLISGVPAVCSVLRVRCPGPLGSCCPVCLLGGCLACALSWDTWILFTGVFARWVVSRVRFLRPLGSFSRVCSLGALCCVCGVLGHLAPVHRCAISARCVACAVSRDS